MAQAISNKVLVQSAKYCWMICDYSMSGTTMSYTLSFYFEGGCAQLDNAWIKVGGTTIWSNTGRVHNFESSSSPAHTVSIHSGTATISGTQTVTFGITKYSGVDMSGSFTVSGVDPTYPPSGLTCTINSTTWNSVSGVFAVGNWGGTPADYIAARLKAEHNGGPRLEETSNGISSLSATIGNNSTPLEGGITIKGCGTYYADTYASNSAGNAVSAETICYTPQSPLAISYIDRGGGGAKVYSIAVTGVVAENNTTYDAAELLRTVRYKIGNDGLWTYADNAIQRAVGDTTSFNIVVPAQSTATIEGWTNYHGVGSESVSAVITNSNDPVNFYGSFNLIGRKAIKMYGSVDGKTKLIEKFYGSADDESKKVFEA